MDIEPGSIAQTLTINSLIMITIKDIYGSKLHGTITGRGQFNDIKFSFYWIDFKLTVIYDKQEPENSDKILRLLNDKIKDYGNQQRNERYKPA